MRLPLLVAGLTLPAILPAFAAEDTTQLEPIIVTATRTEAPADATASPVTVISRADIEKSQATSVQDLLSGNAGITVSNNGGPGKVTSVFMRGTNSDHVLVMIDGVKIGSASTGTAAFQDIPVELIDHIEIVRGPHANLYGSEAIGGVIQIFTRKGGPARTTFSAGGGSHGTAQSSGTVSGSIGNDVWYNFGLSGMTTSGINACKGRPWPNGAGCYTYEPDKDGYDNFSGSARVGWRFASWGEAEANLLRTQGRSDYDGTYVNHSETEQQVLGTAWTLTPADYLKTTIRLAESEDKSKNYLDALYRSRFDTRRDMASVQSDLGTASGPHLITGVDWMNDHVISDTPYDVDARANTGVFAQVLTDHDGHSIQLALRHDENEQFGGHTTGSAGWAYKFVNGLRLTASYGTAFKAPTFNQLYYPGFGNPDLRPELSKTAEIGLSGDLGRVHWTVNAFETRVTDLIGFDASFVPANIDTARIRGIETTLSTRLVSWDLRGNLTLLDPENESDGANRGNLLSRRARQAWALNADRGFGLWSMGATVRGEGLRYDDLANTIKLAPYAVVDLRAEYRISDDWRAQVKVENVFDTDYETAYLYNQPGRSIYLTLRYQH